MLSTAPSIGSHLQQAAARLAVVEIEERGYVFWLMAKHGPSPDSRCVHRRVCGAATLEICCESDRVQVRAFRCPTADLLAVVLRDVPNEGDVPFGSFVELWSISTLLYTGALTY